MRSPRKLEGYLPEDDVKRFAYRAALQSAHERDADLILRAVRRSWPFERRRVAPKAVVAADLLDSLDQRTRRAGEALFQQLDR